MVAADLREGGQGLELRVGIGFAPAAAQVGVDLGRIEVEVGADDFVAVHVDGELVGARHRQYFTAVLAQLLLSVHAVPSEEHRILSEENGKRHGLAVGAIRSVADLANSDWASERGAIVEVDDRGGGTFRLPNAPWRFSDAEDVGVHGAVRYRGEDNADVLRELLGSTDAEIARWEADGVLSHHLPATKA